ncbi:MAG: DUF1573 domain-containing protein [Bacteroidales bacterium]|jgi:hypothetical protein|nr:DUF1573 domain-containing protein [Bacteroidales bacterium]
MKRFAIAAFVLLMTVTLHAQMNAPQVNFEVKSHDFGEIKEADGPATYIFKFNNIGSEPLILKNVRASCGCTTPKWTKEPILPNGEGQLEVTYNPRNRPGSFRKTITVTTNTEPANVYLSITGKVIARTKTVEEKYPFVIGALRVKRMHLSFFNMTNVAKKPMSLEVLNPTKQTVTVTFPNLPSHITAPDVTIAAGKEGKLTFTYDAALKNDWGYVNDNVMCLVDGVKANKPLKLSATITEDFSKLSSQDRANAPKATLSSRKLDFGSVKRGESVVQTFTIKNTGKNLLLIHSVKSTSTIVKCSVSQTEVPVGEIATVELVLDTNRTKGRQYKTVNVISNDPTAPNLTFTLSGAVM